MKFVRYLPEFGVTPVVVAGPERVTSRWTPEDSQLSEELSSGLRVYRPASIPRFSQSRLLRLLGRPTGVEAWWASVLRRPAEEAIVAHRPDVLFVTLSPFAALETVLALGARHRLPVVADLRDPWALDEVTIYPSRLHRARAVANMGRQLARCDWVILNTPEALRAVRATFPTLDERRLTVITNGYDPSDFEGLAPRKPDGRFRLVHTGYLHTEAGFRHAHRGALRRALGGEACEIDFWGRSPYYLVEALRRLRESGVDLSLLDVHFLGVLVVSRP